MAHENLVCKTFLHDEEGSAVVFLVSMIGVGSNGVVLGILIKLHNLGSTGHKLVGCPMMVQSSHGV
jgi:hypothetical protein